MAYCSSRRFGWLDHQPQYAAFLTPSSPTFPHSSSLDLNATYLNEGVGKSPRADKVNYSIRGTPTKANGSLAITGSAPP
jgi:hypothetical protein